ALAPVPAPTNITDREPVRSPAVARPTAIARDEFEPTVRKSSALPLVAVCFALFGILIGAGVVALVWRFGDRPEKPPAKPPENRPIVQRPVESEPVPNAWWRRFASAEGGFQIQFPGEPKLEEKEIAFAVGKVKRFAYMKGFGNPDVSFWADYMDITPEVAR